MLVSARHPVYGVCRVPQRTVDRWPDLWEPVDAGLASPEPGLYDPAEHRLEPVDDDDGVLAYLAAASPEERERVIAAERGRGLKARKTVLDWQPPDDEDPDPAD